jgi:uncharacterized protein (TIGR04255 family)
MMMPGDQRLDAHLPSFRDPPINEVVLGIQFSAPQLGAIHIGKLYDRLARDYPQIQQVPALPPSFESFAPAPAGMTIPIVMMPQMAPRQWFISDNDERLIQFQMDRLLANWRRREGGGPYPRYSAVRAAFVGALNAFDDLMNKDVGAPFATNQCEVSYINHIPLPGPDGWGHPGRWTRLWRDEEPSSEGVQFVTRNLLRDSSGQPFARMTTELQGGQIGETPILTLNLTVRGRPLSADREGVLDFLDTARASIVRRFAAITTPEAHAVWGKDP